MLIVQALPEWFPTVPIFTPVDPDFCLATYFLDNHSEKFETKKYYTDWIENNSLCFIRWYKDYQILYDWKQQMVMVSGYDRAYESTSISLHLLDSRLARWEVEDIVTELAQKFIDALVSTQPSPGQLQLQLEFT